MYHHLFLIRHMAVLLAAVPLLLSTSSIGARAIQHFDCGAEPPSADVMATISQFHDAAKAAQTSSRSGSAAARARAMVKRADRNLVVDTYFHVVSGDSDAGSVTDQMVADQLAVLQTAYGAHQISFNLLATDRTIHNDWSTGNDEPGMKRALRQGSYTALNLYFLSSLQADVLGKCTLPGTVDSGSDLFYADGCLVAAGSLPAGPIPGYNQGFTAVHEAGHWLGLLHTFEGAACDGDGDFILDTAVEATPTDGCPLDPPKKSCPGSPDVDPIHNYMDYSYDACYERFTPDQEDRIYQMWDEFRAGK
ncbi:MAG: hypothetical protein M1826_002636 [Phylliscum demangeonii]|nr:MAG: hypothetical protein M1826_002636 [Phylliscum demangeonii]